MRDFGITKITINEEGDCKVEVNLNTDVKKIVASYGYSYEGYRNFLRDFARAKISLCKKIDEYFCKNNLSKIFLTNEEFEIDEVEIAHKKAIQSLKGLKRSFDEAFEVYVKDIFAKDFEGITNAIQEQNEEQFRIAFESFKADIDFYYGTKESRNDRDFIPNLSNKYLGLLLDGIKQYMSDLDRDIFACSFYCVITEIKSKMRYDMLNDLFKTHHITERDMIEQPIYDTDGTVIDRLVPINYQY